jgi:hypothetical protein
MGLNRPTPKKIFNEEFWGYQSGVSQSVAEVYQRNFNEIRRIFGFSPGSHLAVLIRSSLFAAVQHTSATYCKSNTSRLSPYRNGSAPFVRIGRFLRVSVGVSPPGVTDVFS